MSDIRHDPAYYDGHRHGAWCICSCGWKSRIYVSVTGAVLAHGEHLTHPEVA